MRQILVAGLVLAALASCQSPVNTTSKTGSRSINSNYSNIPLVLILYPRIGYEGSSINVLESTPDLEQRGFSSLASSAAVMRGPGYDAYVAAYGEPTINLYTGVNYTGATMKLRVGEYSTLENIPNNGGILNQTIQSVKFFDSYPSPVVTPDLDTDGSFSSIPLVVEAYQGTGYISQYQIFLVRSEPNIAVTTKYFAAIGKGTVVFVLKDKKGKPTIHTASVTYTDTRLYTRNSSRQSFLNSVVWTIPEIPIVANGFVKFLAARPIYGYEVYNTNDAVYQPDTALNMPDQISSLVVKAGPNYDAAHPSVANFYADPNYAGQAVSLGVGNYPDLGTIQMNDRISSIALP